MAKPKEDFTHHFHAEGSLRIGQAFIEGKDLHPKKSFDVDILLHLKIKILDTSQGKFVKDNIMGLWTFLTLQSSLDFKSLHLEATLENDIVNVELTGNKEELMFDIQKNNMDHDYCMLILYWTEKLKPTHGKTNAILRLGIGPAFFLNSKTTFEQVFYEAFNIAVSVKGDQQIKSLLQNFIKSLREESDRHKDLISDKLTNPLCDYVEENILKQQEAKLEYIYDRNNLQAIIDLYNSQWGYDNVRESYRRTKDPQNGMLSHEMINMITGGFFSSYFKLLTYIDLDNIEFGFWNNIDATSLKAKINIVGANELLKEVLNPSFSGNKEKKSI